MNISSEIQINYFLLSLLLGVLLCIVFDFFRVLRLIGLNGKISVFIEDMLFFIIAALSIFVFYMKITDGKFRLIVPISALLGFIIYRLTIGKLLFFCIKNIVNLIIKFFNFVYKNITLKVFRFIRKSVKKITQPVAEFFKKNVYKNIKNFFKNLLPKPYKMLYNTNKVRRGSQKNKGKVKSTSETQRTKEKVFFC